MPTKEIIGMVLLALYFIFIAWLAEKFKRAGGVK